MKGVVRGLLLLFLLLTLVACPPPPPVATQFNIELRYAPDFPLQYKAAFEIAKQRWQDIIVGDIPDANGLWDVNTSCGLVNQAPVTSVDDLVIFVSTFSAAQSDGVGGLYGKAGPCDFRPVSFLPITATMDFDIPDLADAQTKGELNSLIIHEMAHALGFGTIWGQKALVTETQNSIDCGQDPQYTGVNAVREYQALGGTGNIPLETQYGLAGCGHWLETLFSAEIVTEDLNANVANPISRMTIGAMEDLGYLVDYSRAEAYALPNIVNNAEYNIRVIFEKDFPDALKPSFRTAALRWKSIITVDIPNLEGVFNPADCGVPKLTRYYGIDDIVIYVGIIPTTQSAGPNGLKYRAEPCQTRSGSFLPKTSVIQYSSDNMPTPYQNPESPLNRTTVAFTRDIARALGFGTNWLKKGLISGSVGNGLCSSDSEYTGSNAVREAQLLGEVGNIIFRNNVYYIPNDPPKKCDEFWNIVRYANEMMGGVSNHVGAGLGLIDPPPALSKVTIGAMQDLGYTVNYNIADPIELPIQHPTDPCPPVGCT